VQAGALIFCRHGHWKYCLNLEAVLCGGRPRFCFDLWTRVLFTKTTRPRPGYIHQRCCGEGGGLAFCAFERGAFAARVRTLTTDGCSRRIAIHDVALSETDATNEVPWRPTGGRESRGVSRQHLPVPRAISEREAPRLLATRQGLRARTSHH